MSGFEARKRDWFLSETVYKEQINFFESKVFNDASLDEWNKLITSQDKDSDYKKRLSWGQVSYRLRNLILRYSAGEDINRLQEPCQQMFEEFTRHYNMFADFKMQYWEADAYQYLMWMLGLAYLFNKSEYVPQIATWFAHNPEGPDDPLICALFAKLGCAAFNNPQDLMVFDKTYRPLLQALQAADAGNKTEAQQHLKAYLKHWYKGMKDCYWYDRHKGKFATHFGYWSFEAGMVTLLCELDDTSYREMLYYPKDLVACAKQA